MNSAHVHVPAAACLRGGFFMLAAAALLLASALPARAAQVNFVNAAAGDYRIQSITGLTIAGTTPGTLWDFTYYHGVDYASVPGPHLAAEGLIDQINAGHAVVNFFASAGIDASTGTAFTLRGNLPIAAASGGNVTVNGFNRSSSAPHNPLTYSQACCYNPSDTAALPADQAWVVITLQPEPEIAVSGNSVDIPDGDTTPGTADGTDFGKVALTGGSVASTFTITNSGAAVLNLTGTAPDYVTLSGTGATHFSVTTQPASATVASGGGTQTFVVTFDPSAAGTHTATVSIANDDTDENPFTFDIQGTGNTPPTDITLTPSSIAENNAVGAVVGTLDAVDADVADTHTFTLVAGAGSTDNGSFTLDGTDLKLTPVADYETKSSYSLRVQADDGDGGTFEKALTVTVTNVNDAPSFAISLSATQATVSTLAGSPGLSGSVDGTGAAARFNNPWGNVSADTAGNVYVADQANHIIRKITPAGVVTTIAGSAGLTGSADGTGAAARFNYPNGVVVDPAGMELFVVDLLNNTIRRINLADNAVTTFAGTAGVAGASNGTGAAARFNYPIGITRDSAGNLYVTESNNNTLRKITPGAVVTTLASFFNNPYHPAVDSAGNVYVPQPNRNTIIKVTPGGVKSTFAGTDGVSGTADGTGAAARFSFPLGVAVDAADNVYVADYNNHTVRMITPAAEVTTLAGLAGSSGSANSTGSTARFNRPGSLTVDGNGVLYAGDNSNFTVRKIAIGPQPLTVAEDSGAYTGAAFLVSISAGDAGQTVSFTVSNNNNALFSAQPAIAPNGTLTFTPAANQYGSATVTIEAVDDGGTANGGVDTSAPQDFTLIVTPVNDPPTDIMLTPTSIAENNVSGVVVGSLAALGDPETGDTHTFTLVAGAGSTDNGSFEVDGEDLKLNAVADFEAKPSYSLRVQADDGNGGVFAKALTVTITDVNEAPVSIGVTDPQKPAGAVAWWRADGNANDSTANANHGTAQNGATFGAGRTDQAFSLDGVNDFIQVPHSASLSFTSSFTIEGWVYLTNRSNHYMLVTKAPSSAPTNYPGNYEVRIQPGTGLIDLGFEHSGGLFFGSSNTAVPLNQWAHVSVVLTVGTGVQFYVNGAAAGSAATAATPITNTNPLRIGSRMDGYFFQGSIDDLAIYNRALNSTEIAALHSSAPGSALTIAENAAIGTSVGTLAGVDPDAGDTLTYSFATGAGDTDNDSFTIVGDQLLSDEVFDFETRSSYSVRVRATDSGGLFTEQEFTITVTDVNEPATLITLTNDEVEENNAVGTLIGQLEAEDPDAGQTHTFTLVAGAGATDNVSFSITGDLLYIQTVADFETQDSYSIRVQANDGNGGTYQEALTITVTDVNDAPVLTGGPVELSPIYDHEATSVVSILSVLADGTVDYQDQDAGAVSGVAVAGASGAGLWEFSATGVTWTSLGTVNDASALLLTESHLVRYTPAYPGPDGGETAALVLRGWDQTGGTAGAAGTKVNASTQGGTAPYSLGTVSLRVAVLEDDRLPTVADVEVNEASPYAVFEVEGAAGQLLTLALGNDANPATADATVAGFTLEMLNVPGTAWVAHTPGSLVEVPAGGTLLTRVNITSEQDEVAEGVEVFTLVAAALSGASSTGLGSIRDDDEGAVFLASNNTSTPNDPDDTGYPVLDDDVVKHILWGGAGSLTEDSQMDATLATTDAFFPLFYEGMGAGLFDVRLAASGMVSAGLKQIGGQPAWSLTASSGGAKALVNFRFFKAGSTTEFKHLKNIVFRIEDAEAGEELSGFSYWDGRGNKVPVLWNNTDVFSYSHTPQFTSSNTAVVNVAPLESLTQAGKWIQVDLRGLQVTGIEFSHRKSSSSAGSVVITHLAGQMTPDALDFGGTFSPLQVKANASDEGTVPDYRPQATWTGAPAATVSQTPAPGTQLPLGAHEITLALDDGSGVVAVQGFDLLVVAPKLPLLVVSTPTTTTTALSTVSPYTVSGTVLDREGVGMSKVEVVHNGALLSATLGAPGGTSALAWSLGIAPVEGVNTLSVTAEDSNGIRSLTVERSFTFTRRYALDLTAQPAQGVITLKSGTVRSTTLLGTSGATKNYSVLPAVSLTLTAAPKAGHVFSHWSGLPGVAQSAGNVMKLVMPSADITGITAHFASNPFLPPAGAGSSFQGLLRPLDAADTANDTVAMLSGTLATSGGFSGKLMLAGLTHSFAATFQGDGSSTFTVAKVKVGALILPGGHQLSLAFSSGMIEATLVKAGVTSTGTLRRGIYSTAAKVPQTLLNRKSSASLAANNQGFLTAALPARAQTPARALSTYPQGDGYTTLTLRDNGTLLLSGLLADGGTITASSLLVEADTAPVFAQLLTPGAKTRHGSLSGTLALLPGVDSDVTGSDMLWIRPGVAQISGTSATAKATQIYTAGWPAGITLDLVGAFYDSSLTVQAGLALPAPLGGAGNARLDFSDGKLASDLAVTDFYITSNTVAKIPATNKTFTLTVSAAKATFTGTFTPNWTGAVTAKPAFKGIILQKGSDGPGGYGFFLSNRASDLDPESGRATLGAPLP